MRVFLLQVLLVATCFGQTLEQERPTMVVTVGGTGDPKVDIPAVQAAVNRGGRVVLKGRFSFDAPPKVTEQPSRCLARRLWVWC